MHRCNVMGLYTITAVVWFAILIIVLVLTYFYWRDLKERRKKSEEKVKQLKEKKDSGGGYTNSGKGYTVVIKEDGSLQVLFEDGKTGERPSSGRPKGFASYRGTGKEGAISNGKSKGAKVFVDRSQMIKFLGETITYDLPEIIPEERGTYVLILYAWKNEVTPIENPEILEAPLDAPHKICKQCGTQNDSDALYCKNCGRKLN